MPKIITHEEVYEYYKNEGYLLKSIYKGCKNKDELICPEGHEIEMTFNNFKSYDNKPGKRCGKCFGTEKYHQEYVFDYYKKYGYILRSIHKNNRAKDELICPNNHKVKMLFDNFKNKGSRCIKCSGSEKFTQQFVFNYYQNEGYTLTSIYNGGDYKDELTCPVGHKVEMLFNNFKNKNSRCIQCHIDNNRGDKHYRFKTNREELLLNQRLRISKKNPWIKKHMKEDPNYNNYINDPDQFVVDHIIPVKLFCKLYTEYNLDEHKLRKVINKRENLQLLTREQNSDKGAKGCINEAKQYLIKHNIQLINT